MIYIRLQLNNPYTADLIVRMHIYLSDAKLCAMRCVRFELCIFNHIICPRSAGSSPWSRYNEVHFASAPWKVPIIILLCVWNWEADHSVLPQCPRWVLGCYYVIEYGSMYVLLLMGHFLLIIIFRICTQKHELSQSHWERKGDLSLFCVQIPFFIYFIIN